MLVQKFSCVMCHDAPMHTLIWFVPQFLIETRHRAVVSVAAGNPDLEQQHPRHSKTRPASAPVTRTESDTAQLGAGETHAYEQRALERRQRPHTSKPRIVQQIELELAQSTAAEAAAGASDVGQSTDDKQTLLATSRGGVVADNSDDDDDNKQDGRRGVQDGRRSVLFSNYNSQSLS